MLFEDFDDRPFLTAELVARRSGVTARRVRQLAQASRIPSRRLPEGTLVFPEDAPELVKAQEQMHRLYGSSSSEPAVAAEDGAPWTAA